MDSHCLLISDTVLHRSLAAVCLRCVSYLPTLCLFAFGIPAGRCHAYTGTRDLWLSHLQQPWRHMTVMLNVNILQSLLCSNFCTLWPFAVWPSLFRGVLTLLHTLFPSKSDQFAYHTRRYLLFIDENFILTSSFATFLFFLICSFTALKSVSLLFPLITGFHNS